MAPPDLTIRPLSLGEVIDRAVALTRRHFRVLFSLMLLVQVPALLLYRWYAAGLGEMVESVSRGERPQATPLALAGSAAAVLAVLPFLQLVASSAVAMVVAPSLAGRPPLLSLGAALRAFLPRAWAVASATVLQMAVLFLAPVLGAIPGALLAWRSAGMATRLVGLSAAILGSMGLLLAAVLRLSLAPAAAGVEGLAGLRALARSARLMSPGRGLSLDERPAIKASLLLLATFLLALAVNGLAGLPRAVAALAAGRGAMETLPLGAEVGLGIFEALASAAVQPFGLVAITVFYFDRRARREGLDLDLWAARLGAEARP